MGEIMNIKINKNGDGYIQNIAFVKAVFINEYIEHMNISLNEKEQIKKEVLNLLCKP